MQLKFFLYAFIDCFSHKPERNTRFLHAAKFNIEVRI